MEAFWRRPFCILSSSNKTNELTHAHNNETEIFAGKINNLTWREKLNFLCSIGTIFLRKSSTSFRLLLNIKVETFWGRTMLTIRNMKQRGRWRRPQNRKAFLMRLWREDEEAPWRILLQAVEDGKQRNFANIQAFITHLEELVQEENETNY